ncbi:hypothetical protein GU926_13910 [Nibribacter ruber]|uniref:Lipoprotein n=1 Tax=Nibribacter ruber TaxID=2698458 RepID=A0A6P1P249_9BACT|nr:hypothetical protein [Nibribacter ruber]QHL88469.1 hypothetical protein GU926_13910 [Nibribacter ruber]
MKRFNSIFMLLVAVFFSVTLTSCPGGGDDDEDLAGNCTEELRQAYLKVSDTAQAWAAANGSAATCAPYKDAVVNLIAKAKQCGTAAEVQQGEQLLTTLKQLCP